MQWKIECLKQVVLLSIWSATIAIMFSQSFTNRTDWYVISSLSFVLQSTVPIEYTITTRIPPVTDIYSDKCSISLVVYHTVTTTATFAHWRRLPKALTKNIHNEARISCIKWIFAQNFEYFIRFTHFYWNFYRFGILLTSVCVCAHLPKKKKNFRSVGRVKCFVVKIHPVVDFPEKYTYKWNTIHKITMNVVSVQR